MNRRSIVILYAIIAAVSLNCCDYHGQYRQVPFSVQRYLAELPYWQAPRKVEVDYQRGRIYWLNRNGEIWAINANGSEKTLINKGIGAKLGVTYIEDFALDYQKNILYFTDLMDVVTGLSALKKSTLQGDSITLVASFPGETLYAVSWNSEQQQLYYATRGQNARYRVRRLGELAPLAITNHKINLSALFSENSRIQNYENQLVSD